MTLARCNPYGYATDTGPKHLMGGFYGPEYAGHQGPIMDLCRGHVQELQARMSDCCTRCVWPDQARGVNEAMDYVMLRMAEAREHQDRPTLIRLGGQLD